MLSVESSNGQRECPKPRLSLDPTLETVSLLAHEGDCQVNALCHPKAVEASYLPALQAPSAHRGVFGRYGAKQHTQVLSPFHGIALQRYLSTALLQANPTPHEPIFCSQA